MNSKRPRIPKGQEKITYVLDRIHIVTAVLEACLRRRRRIDILLHSGTNHVSKKKRRIQWNIQLSSEQKWSNNSSHGWR